MLGRRGDFEGLADWLSMLPLWGDTYVWRVVVTCPWLVEAERLL